MRENFCGHQCESESCKKETIDCLEEKINHKILYNTEDYKR